MTAFTAKVTSLLNAGKGFTTTLLNNLWDNTTYAKEQIESHVHDGNGSAKIPIGPNYLRNGSFEDSSTAGWTLTQYTGGTVAINTSNPLDGNTSLAFTSTVLANGGGDAVSNEYIPVTDVMAYLLKAIIKASAANISSKMEIIWYDSGKAQISLSTVYSSSNTPTALTAIGGSLTAPSTARFMRTKITGGVPATGTSTGTIYFDGLFLSVGGFDASLHVREETTSNGGTSVVGDQVRVLNTVVSNTILNASLSSNQITLPKGTYSIHASAPCLGGVRHRIRLVNVTDSTVLMLGTSEAPGSSDPTQTSSFIRGIFTLAATKNLNITHYIVAAQATNGLGVNTADGLTNVYTSCLITKVE
ncbi:MAG: hypothetical protein Q7S51_04420 [Gallionellaceae bacterium]|nr:hypothetical protein [Gallionellaceae bacterium]